MKALAHFQATLKTLKEEEAKAGRYSMVAMSLIGIAASAWIGAMIELKIYPRLASKWVDGFTNGKYWVKSPEEVDEVVAKFFGDTFHEILGHALDKVFESVMPEPADSKGDNSLLDSTLGCDLGNYKTFLQNEMFAASEKISKQLTVLSGNINTSQDFGDAVLKEVNKRLPRGSSQSDRARESAGMDLLDDYFQKLREQYAKDCFYYRNKPVNGRVAIFAFHFEIEMWALWITAQNWKLDHYADFAVDGEVAEGARYWTNGTFRLEDIMDALEDLASAEDWMELTSSQPDPDELATASALVGAAKTGGTDRDAASADLARMMAWAKDTPGELLHGNLDYRPRSLGHIKNANSVVADI